MLPDLSKEIHEFLRAFVKADYTVLPLAGDASSRKYFRVIAGDRSWVLMSWEPFSNPDTYPFLDVQKHFAKYGVRVPAVEKIGPELGVVLLEDLGDLTLERKFWENQNQEMALPYYQQSIDELIKIHFLTSQPQKDPSICQITEFDTAKFMWEMNYAREHLLEKLAGIQMSPALQSQLQSIFTDICERLHAEPKYVCHRDYHSRNVMLKLGQVCVIDFQDARKGPIQYDLVSLVHDSYVTLSPASKEFILKDYLAKAKQYLPKNFSRAHFDEIFEIQTIQRCFKACGSFSSFYNARKDLRYLKYIHPTINLVAQTLASQPKYAELLNVIKGEGLLEKNFETLCAG